MILVGLLHDLDATSSALALLSSREIKLVQEALRLTNAMIEGPNPVIVTAIIRNFYSNPEESFFPNMERLLKMAITEVKDIRRTISDQLKSSLVLSTSGTMANSNASLDMETYLSGVIDPTTPTVSPYVYECFTLLYWLTLGTNQELYRFKNYLRQQNTADMRTSYNLVRQSVIYVKALETILEPKYNPLIIRVFETLTTMVQGCPENQEAVVKYKIVSPLNNILAKGLKLVKDFKEDGRDRRSTARNADVSRQEIEELTEDELRVKVRLLSYF